MKSYLNSTKQLQAAGLLLVACTLLTYGCKQVNSPLEVTSENGQTIEGLNINVKYAESYDQTEITYSRLWPDGISTGFQKVSANSNGELLVDYERTHEVVAYDQEGYMTSVTEYVEGDGEINMPEDTYNQLKATIPAKSADYDPIIRKEFSNGYLSYYSKSGRQLERYPVNKEFYKVDPDLLDSLQQNDSTAQKAIKNNLLKIENSGIAFNRIGERFIEFRKKAITKNELNDTAFEHYVLDLQNGNILLYAELKANGDIISLTQSLYKNVNGFYILSSEDRYTYGNINNGWDVIQKTKMYRDNIQIIHN